VVVSSGDDATDFGAPQRVYWTLKVLGLKELSVLNGGVQAWAAAGLPLDTACPRWCAQHLRAGAGQFADRHARRTAGAACRHPRPLLDARPRPSSTGETRHQASLVPGTLKGAVNLEYTRWFAPDSSVMLGRRGEAPRRRFRRNAGGRDTVSFCNTGHWAATNWFALSEVAGTRA
jgi:thiosulfate/3-mercaptopyruvate sulfurtransferase